MKKYLRLTSTQLTVLSCHRDKPERAVLPVPHGVYRSLVIRGLLRPWHGGYELTPEGHDAISPLRWSKL